MKNHGNLRLLIADDDPLVSLVIAGYIARLGHTLLTTATNGQEAIELTTRLHPDAVLMDVTMPVMDGLEASEKIQQNCPTPIIILSAHDERSLVDKAAAAGVGAYLVKPGSPSELDRALAVAIARHTDLMELRRLNSELRSALHHIKTLTGLLPICCQCKKIRDEEGAWTQLESFISRHSEAQFTHTYCPDCAAHFLATNPVAPPSA